MIILWAGLSIEGVETVRAQQTPSAAPQQNPSAAQPSGGQPAQSADAPPANPTAPPSEAPKRSKDDLEKLVAPIALYPDPLIATILPASAYPLEIVEAARFVKDTNNIAKIDEQKWDDNVKAVARIPDVISQMDQNIGWVGDLGDAFISQPKELMDAIQAMRTKAEDSGALKTTEQQVVNTTNNIVTNTVQNETVYVTNQVTQIQPAQQDTVYVPQYNPTEVYAGAPTAYPGYVAPRPLVGTALTFGAGMAMGAWINNDCDWHNGGCWGGNYHSDVNVNRNVHYNRNVNYNQNVNANRNGQKWQPDQNRLKNSGASLNSAENRQARGYASGTGQAANRSANAASAANRASAVEAANRTATASAANRPSTGTAANRPETGTAANRASAAGQNAAANGANRASAGTGGTGAAANRTEGNLAATGSRSGAAANTAQSRPSSSPSASSGGNAFSGGSASAARSSSARGSASRSGGGQGGGGGGAGGASRGGGGGGRRR